MQNTHQEAVVLSVDAVFKEAWQNVKGVKGSVFIAEVYLCFITLLFLFLFSLIGLVITSVLPGLGLFLRIISAFISGGLLICGIAYLNRFCIKKQSGCKPVLTFKSFFRPYAYLWQAMGLYFLNTCCIAILSGFVFFSFVVMETIFEGTAAIAKSFSGATDVHYVVYKLFILGISGVEIVIAFFVYSFFTTVFQLAIPVAMQQKIRVFLALKLLFMSFGAQFFKIVWINALCFLIILVSIIPLGIGLIWSLPLAYNLNASIYKRTLGLVVQKKAED